MNLWMRKIRGGDKKWTCEWEKEKDRIGSHPNWNVGGGDVKNKKFKCEWEKNKNKLCNSMIFLSKMIYWMEYNVWIK